jgi:NADPH:quinone reductase
MEETGIRALRLNSFGSWKDLSLETVPAPEPTANSPVLVRVRAASINPVDMKMCSGKGLAKYLEDSMPVTLGYDIAGDVVSAGTDTGFKEGDRVCGMIGFPGQGGAFAEYAVTRPEDIALIPEGVSFEVAAATPLVGLTALQTLFELGNLQAGETLLITAASGGVGQYMVQLAHWKGARIIGTCSTRNVEFLKSLGVDVVLDYTRESVTSITENIDLAVNGVITATDVMQMPGITERTRRITIVSLPDDNPAWKEFFPTRMLVHPDRAQLDMLMDLLSRKIIKPRITGSFDLKDFAKAFEVMETGHAGGKLILLP